MSIVKTDVPPPAPVDSSTFFLFVVFAESARSRWDPQERGGTPYWGSIIFSGFLEKPAYPGGVGLRSDSDRTPTFLSYFLAPFERTGAFWAFFCYPNGVLGTPQMHLWSWILVPLRSKNPLWKAMRSSLKKQQKY